jgi:hypothetical protein
MSHAKRGAVRGQEKAWACHVGEKQEDRLVQEKETKTNLSDYIWKDFSSQDSLNP